jgi:hypothetical protein
MKKAIPIRIDLYNKILSLWEIIEQKMFKKIISGELTKKDKKKIEGLKKISIVPKVQKIEYVKNYIRDIIKVYSLRMKNYNASKKMFSGSTMSLSWYNIQSLKINEQRPVSPNILEEFTEDVLETLILKAMKKRSSSRLSSRPSMR